MRIYRIIWIFFELLIKGRDNIYLKVFINSIKSSGNNITLKYPFYFYNPACISIGNNFVAHKGLKIRAFKEFNMLKYNPQIVIKDNVSIETDCHIGCINRIEIGNNVLIASGVYISDHSHGLQDYSDLEISPLMRKLTSKGPVIIEDNVWIGERVIILSGD